MGLYIFVSSEVGSVQIKWWWDGWQGLVFDFFDFFFLFDTRTRWFSLAHNLTHVPRAHKPGSFLFHGSTSLFLSRLLAYALTQVDNIDFLMASRIPGS